MPRQRDHIGDHRRLQLGDLAAPLAGGEGIVPADSTDTKPEVRIRSLIAAPGVRSMLRPDGELKKVAEQSAA